MNDQIGAPAASPPRADIGQPVVLSANVSVGIHVITFAWTGLPEGCASANASDVLCTPSAAGNWSVGYTVIESNGTTAASTTLRLEIYSDPFVGALSTSRLSVDVGQAVNISAQAEGGLQPYTLSWLGLPPGCSGATFKIICLPNGSGSFTISVMLTDANNYTVSSQGLFFSVYPVMNVGRVQATSSYADVDQSVSFFVVVTGGSGGYAFIWSGLPPGCASASSATVDCIPSDNGTFVVGVQVTDSDGQVRNALPMNFTAFSAYFCVGYPTESRFSMDLGQTVYFTEACVGGFRPYIYNWSDLPPNCKDINSDNISCTPSSWGTYWVSVEIRDQTGAWYDTDAVELSVIEPLTGASLVAVPGTLTVGQSLSLGVSVGGGTGVYTYYWSGLPPGCTPNDQSTIACTPTSAGSFQVSVTVTDSNGGSSSATTTVVVSSAVGISSGGLQLAAVGAIAALLIVVFILAVLALRRRSIKPEDEEGGEPEPPVMTTRYRTRIKGHGPERSGKDDPGAGPHEEEEVKGATATGVGDKGKP